MANPLRVIQLPVWRDNYAYLVVDQPGGHAALVDGPEAAPVLAALGREGLTLKAIWNTHHHFDHVGANQELLKQFPHLEVAGFAGDAQRLPGLNRPLQEGDTLTLGSLCFDVRHTPGHTSGHLAFVGHGAAFVGDTLFALGCGRLFEGTPQQMFTSLTQTLGELPGETLIYCAHEYTQSNLAFALHLLPQDAALAQAAPTIAAKREAGQPTVPTTLAWEKTHNPFLRCHEPAVSAAVAAHSGADTSTPLAVFAAMRTLKDRF